MVNPFSLTFGKSPFETIARPIQISEIVENFSSETVNQQVFLITGLRGSGKTVLMTDVCKIFKQESDWIVLELNPELDLLESLMSKLVSNNQCSEIFKSAKINLSFWGFGLELGGGAQITDRETAITKMLESLKKKKKRLLISIDEVTDSEYMRIFASSFQIFIRQDLPVYLLMTGLYENIEELQNEKNLTFLYRTPKIELKGLNIRAIASKYKSIFKLEEEAALRMAKLTKGYPFAFQVLGFLTWNKNGDFEAVLDDYQQYLEEFVYEKLWSELSPKDKFVLNGMARAKDNKIISIREQLGLDTNGFNPYRKRLIKKGLIDGEERGILKFTLPLFENFVRAVYE
ncbi:ATP-binding protein [Treponema sp. UBA3813]|uniref:ATP-binding protein n=1 Tax=Treponema sp. UBA3813 TaxID=1947715 RepID=UPI0025FF35AC|nr:ATP-binding protein [Treponema sp. UBA3813]